jgi:nucleoside-diphosphate-sugar epimerase
MSLNNKTILITGGAGAIGTQLIKKVSPLCKKVVVLDNLSSGYRWNIPQFNNLLFIEGDVTSDIDLRRCFAEKPDIIFHLAAFFANQNSVDYPQKDLHTNGLGTLKLYEYSALYGRLDRLVYASSGCSIYGKKEMPFVEEETDFMNLTTPYQVTKGLGEIYGNYFFHAHKLPITYARFFNSYGPGEVPGQYRNVIPNFIYWAKKGMPLPITGTGEETRDFTYVEDIVNGLITMATCKKDVVVGEAFNLAAGREIKIIDLANKINTMAGNKDNIIFKQRRDWDTKPRLLASTEKAETVLGFKAKQDFETGLVEAFKWFEKEWENIVESANFKPGMSSAVR